MIQHDLYTFLSTNAAIAAVSGTRAWPAPLPQEVTLPALTYNFLPGEREYAHDGDQNLMRYRVQVSAWGGTYEAARGLAETLVTALNDWAHGPAFASTPYDLPQPSVPVHQVAVDILFWYKS